MNKHRVGKKNYAAGDDEREGHSIVVCYSYIFIETKPARCGRNGRDKRGKSSRPGLCSGGERDGVSEVS